MTNIALKTLDFDNLKKKHLPEIFSIFDTDNHSLLDHLYSDDFSAHKENKRMEAIGKPIFDNPTGLIHVHIKQSRKYSDDMQTFESSLISMIIVSAEFWVFEYLKTRTVKDQGFLMDRDTKVSDPYIPVVNEILDEFYSDIFARNLAAFNKTY